MTKQVLLIHGAGEGAYEADAKLAAALRRKLGQSFEVRYPAMPNQEEPNFEAWKCLIEHEVRAIGRRVILVGHSIGGSVIIKIATEGDLQGSVAGLFLVAAPFWHDHPVWRWDEVALSSDATERYPRGVPLFLYHGQEDEVVPVSHVDLYAKALPQAVRRCLSGRNHQLNEDMTEVARDIERLP
ncbi:MAG: alpha/beta fold hydrolase [Caulobacter sp.]